MPRMTIYLPEPLKARMDEEEDVNWSRLAATAFEAELDHRAEQRRELTRRGVARRLRASKRRWESDEFQAGRAEGARWAAEEAEWFHLLNLADACADQEGAIWESTPMAPYDLVDAVLLAIDPAEFDDDLARAHFREQYGMAEGCSIDYLRGFTDGALEVMEEVAPEVEDGVSAEDMDPAAN